MKSVKVKQILYDITYMLNIKNMVQKKFTYKTDS